MFAKIFNSEIYGQILAVIGKDDSDCPEVRFYFKPHGYEICSIALTFQADKKGELSAKDAFDCATLERAERIVGNVYADFELRAGLNDD